ncbi:ATP-dependent RNA helicase DDX6/DHH1 [Nematocida major]|uniref:ATP-dependent RNA helicase DDX6/DHH1 n=1 Tax=Nematocida major TaxID=1912982 RepID=UPI002007F713|nr:ATP-dependent RNA helicase DDX6/DHH1 [Nematocida major]KAH9386838.1 ATP-dependent RNA helicase DDX6/DHH1 [Nematocida major]
MKQKEEKAGSVFNGDVETARNPTAEGKKKKLQARNKDKPASKKQGEIIKIREKIDTLLEKIEQFEKTGSAEDVQAVSAQKEGAKRADPVAAEAPLPKQESFSPKEPAQKRSKDVRPSENDSSRSWESLNLKREVIMGIQKKGFVWASPIQAATIPHSLRGRNIVARAKNGTGKTAAFTIPLLSKINPGKVVIQALILVPTRELVLQTAKVCRELGEFLRLKILPLYGGVSAKDDIIRLKGGAHVIIGTPGRVLDFLSQKAIVLDKCMHLVCDEADKLLSVEFQEVLYEITDMFPEKRQIEMYSATFPAMIQHYIDRYMPDVVKINLMKELTLAGVKQYYAYVKPADKLHCLKTLLTCLDINQCFIFCNSIQTVEKLAMKITELGFTSYYIHSKMRQEDRNRVFHNFTSNQECRILVSTDLVTRGIDVPSVNVVINFDLPQSTESYLHRIGRSGRFGTEGIAINMITPENTFKMREIEGDLEIEMLPFSNKKHEESTA